MEGVILGLRERMELESASGIPGVKVLTGEALGLKIPFRFLVGTTPMSRPSLPVLMKRPQEKPRASRVSSKGISHCSLPGRRKR